MPNAARSYRHWRDEKASAAAPAHLTPFGFKLVGSMSMATGKFESEEIDVFLKYLETHSVCVDIGANIGLYTCLAAARGKKVIAVEPLARNLELLYRNLILNHFEGVEVYPLGLSSKVGIQRLFGSGTGASFIAGWSGSSENWYRDVPVNTLDLILNTRVSGQPLLIKVDVEGFEMELLKGATQTLRSYPKPVWLVEINLNEHFPSGLNDRFVQTFESFWQAGYESRVAAREERLIKPSDVFRWVVRGSPDFGSHNYLFTQPQ